MAEPQKVQVLCPFIYEEYVCQTSAHVANTLEAIIKMLRHMQYPREDIFKIRLALEEAIVNGLKHGNRADEGKRVTTKAFFAVKEVCFDITDEGKGFDPASIPDPRELENLERTSGRGILLMRHFMSEVIFVPPNNRVILIWRKSATKTL